MKKHSFLFFLFVIILSSSIEAHSNILYDVSLDFDPVLKEKVTTAAQNFYGIKEKPLKYDYDYELIVVHFDRKLEYSVSINPEDYSVFGFRDDSKIDKGKEETLDAEQRKKIAMQAFEQLPTSYKEELMYGGEKKLYAGTYEHTWYRYVNKILVGGEHFKVEIDPADGEIVAQRLSLFRHPKEKINTIPAITAAVAKKIAELKANGQPVDFEPVLIIFDNKPLWLTQVKVLYPIYVGINAEDGNVLFSGNARVEIPPDYHEGEDVPVVASAFIQQIYGSGDTS